MSNNEFKSGFVALAGRPNVGKSSLLNYLIGQKIFITSAKPQTTRNQLKGILNGPGYQIIWLDTPGIHRPLHQLGEEMVRTAQNALNNVDLVLWVLDAAAGFTPADRKVAETIKEVEPKVFIVWNKLDVMESPQELPTIPGHDRVFLVSALTGMGIPDLLKAVVAELPPGPAFYPADQLTDHPERFIAAEFIREQILHFTEDEVPHSIAVQVEEMKERPDGLVAIEATIFVERDSQKGIIIGAGGERLKKIGQTARKNLEELLGTRVFLNLWVKVRKNWRNNKKDLEAFGYTERE